MPAADNDDTAAADQVLVIRDPDTGLEAHIVRAGASLQRLLVPVAPKAAAADANTADAAAAANAAAPPPAPPTTRRDVVLGYASARDYLAVDPTCYLGAVVGRVANRVAGARFEAGGRAYALAANNGPNSLHGGRRGLDRRLFDVVVGGGDGDDGRSATLRYVSPAGEEGYPGAVEVEARYSLPPGRAGVLRLEMRARCVAAAAGGANADAGDCNEFALPPEGTPVALAAHSYFNLAGCGGGGKDKAGPPSVLALGGREEEQEGGAAAAPPHVLHMPRAKRITALGPHQIPTGELLPVENTPFDFASRPRALGERAADVPGVDRPGYDHNFVLLDDAGEAAAPGGLLPLPAAEGAGAPPPLPLVATLSAAGLRMDVRSNAPGVQVYTGNYLGGDDGAGDAAAPAPKDGCPPYRRWAGVCLETQNWPDAVNRWRRGENGGGAAFPSPMLRAGEEYVHVVEYCFSSA